MIKLVDMAISIVLGLVLNYFVTSEIIVYFYQGAGSVYAIILSLSIIIQIIFIFSAIQLIRSKEIDRKTYISLWILYFVTMLLLLFGRRTSEGTINLNILDLFAPDSIMQNILNIMFFMPIGYIFYCKKYKISSIVSFSICGVLVIETIQLLLKVGIFDVVDIILNLLGISIGYLISKKFKLEVNTKTNEGKI